jgi:hypothetical protein
MPRIPGLSELLAQLQAQTEALAGLPRTMTDLNNAVRELIAATTVASETIASAQRTAERLEELVGELEEPVRALRPGLERVGRVLDDPAVDTVPDTLRRINEDLMPLIAACGRRIRPSTTCRRTTTTRPRRRTPPPEPTASRGGRRIPADEVGHGLLQPRPGGAPLHQRLEDPLEDGQLLVERLQLLPHGLHLLALGTHRLRDRAQLRRRQRAGRAGEDRQGQPRGDGALGESPRPVGEPAQLGDELLDRPADQAPRSRLRPGVPSRAGVLLGHRSALLRMP